MKSREYRKHIRSDQHVMKVSDDEVGVVHLPIDWDDGGENSVQSANYQERKKPMAKCMAAVGTGRPFQMVAIQQNT